MIYIDSLPKTLSLLGVTLLVGGSILSQPTVPKAAQAPRMQLAQSGLPDVPDVPDIPGVPDALPIPGLSDLLEEDPPLTTSLEDVRREMPLLDGETFSVAQPLTSLPQNHAGAYQALPGFYSATLESYCLKPGTHGPGGGEGYGYATLAGPRADAIDKILRRTVQYPQIPQRDIQKLLWGIIAQTQLKKMSDEVQEAASQLLNEDEIDEIDGNALGLIPDEMRRELFANLPEPVQRVLTAKAELRERLSQGDAAYEELEEIAILTGAVERGEGSRRIPKQRWSLHPEGYFVRYFPSGYAQTQMQVVVPRPATVVRDSKGRITAIDYGDGYRVETEYNDAIGAISVPGEPEMQIYRFQLVRWVSPEQTVVIRDRGWTFVGLPTTGEARLTELMEGSGAIAAKANQPLAQRGTGEQLNWQEVQDAQERYQDAKDKAETVETYVESLDEPTRKEGEEILDREHYQDGMEAVAENDPDAKGEWLGEHLRRAQQAWAYATCKIANLGTDYQCGDPEPNPDPDPAPDPTPVEPGGDAAIPGNTNRQRIGISNRPI